jgi:Rho-binding antiterminator
MRRRRIEVEHYTPIDCTFHDRIEALATTRRRVLLELDAGQPGGKTVAEGVIADIWTAPSKEEFLRLDDGETIRLDRIKAIRPVDPVA